MDTNQRLSKIEDCLISMSEMQFEYFASNTIMEQINASAVTSEMMENLFHLIEMDHIVLLATFSRNRKFLGVSFQLIRSLIINIKLQIVYRYIININM